MMLIQNEAIMLNVCELVSCMSNVCISIRSLTYCKDIPGHDACIHDLADSIHNMKDISDAITENDIERLIFSCDYFLYILPGLVDSSSLKRSILDFGSVLNKFKKAN
jgi:hypothetical protein